MAENRQGIAWEPNADFGPCPCALGRAVQSMESTVNLYEDADGEGNDLIEQNYIVVCSESGELLGEVDYQVDNDDPSILYEGELTWFMDPVCEPMP